MACERWMKWNCCSVTKSCQTLCDSTDCSMPGFSVRHYLLEFVQIHVHWVSDTILPSHPLSPPSPLALNFSRHQDLFQWVSCSYQVAKVLELQLQHQSFQWIFRIDFIKSNMMVVRAGGLWGHRVGYSVSKGSCQRRLGHRRWFAWPQITGRVVYWTQKSICKGAVASPRPHRQIPEKRPAVTASNRCSAIISRVASDCEYLGSDCSCWVQRFQGTFQKFSHIIVFLIDKWFAYFSFTHHSPVDPLAECVHLHTPVSAGTVHFCRIPGTTAGLGTAWSLLSLTLGCWGAYSFLEFHPFITVSSNYPIGVCHLPVRNLTSYSLSWNTGFFSLRYPAFAEIPPAP